MKDKERFLAISKRDIKSSLILYEHRMYAQSLYFLQQSVEKLQKYYARFSATLSEDQMRKMGHSPNYLIDKAFSEAELLSGRTNDEKELLHNKTKILPELINITKYENLSFKKLKDIVSLLSTQIEMIPNNFNPDNNSDVKKWSDIFLNELYYERIIYEKFLNVVQNEKNSIKYKNNVIYMWNNILQMHYPIIVNMTLAYILNPLHSEFKYSDNYDFSKKTNILSRNYFLLYDAQSECLTRISDSSSNIKAIKF